MALLKIAAAGAISATLACNALAGEPGGGLSFAVVDAGGQSQGLAVGYDGIGDAGPAAAATTNYVALPVGTGPIWSAEAYSVQTASATGAGAIAVTQGAVTLQGTVVSSANFGNPGIASASSAASLDYEGTYGNYLSEIYASASIQETANGFLTSAAAGTNTNANAAQGGVTTASDSTVTIFIKGNNALVESRAETLTQINSNGRTYFVANDVAIAVARVTQFGITSTSTATASESNTPVSANPQAPVTNTKGAPAARVQYIGNPGAALIDPSVNDYNPKTGVRLAVFPTLFADLGWRFNANDAGDGRAASFSANSFDGSLTWKPLPFFYLTASAERYAGEPSTAFAGSPDVSSYSVKASYLPVPGVTVSAAGGWQAIRDAGSSAEYRAPFADALVSWAYNNHVQLYTALQYQGYNLDSQYLSSSDVRVMSGIRIAEGGQDRLEGGSLESLPPRVADAHGPVNTDLTVSGGYSWFGLPDIKMVTNVGGQFFDQALGQETNSGGNLNGWRTDARLADFAEAALPDGSWGSFSVSGFFANYQGTTGSHCMFSLTTDCAIVNIVDSDPNNANNTGPFGNLNVKVNRDVDYYGASLDARLGTVEGGLKDGPLAVVLSALKLGVAIRALDETANLTSIDPLVSVPVRYNENLNTNYFGGFIGIEQKAAFGDGWTAAIDGTAGVYYANTEYQGRYNGYAVSFPAGYVQDSGNLDLSLDKASFIGTLRLDIKRQLGWGTVGVFGEGEYLGYVPRILYNNNDQAGGPPWGLIGTQVGTRIGSSDVFNFTSGLSVSVPVN